MAPPSNSLRVGGIFLLLATITYLSLFGLKTDKFNELIYSKISQINPKLSSEINDVFIKLDIKEQTLKLETSNVKLQIAEEYLFLDKIIYIKNELRIFEI